MALYLLANVAILAALHISVNRLVNQFGNAMTGLGIIALGVPAYWWWSRKTE